MPVPTKLTTLLAVGLLAAGTLGGAASTAAAATSRPAGVAPAAAASCISGAWRYDGYRFAPEGDGYYVTTNRCADIQVQPDRETVLRLCYLKDRDEDRKVCKGWLTAKPGKWTVLGTDFGDGTYFYIDFPNSDTLKTGLVAA
ncbi:hypothetical protein [Streptomyces sp. NBC_00158]|uniref:hypothetical protein n=1 Tax=Streptomyces sp. NBC_00158 TaxID=2903627 RepID=UPI002F911121